jgi:hypothetical protein
MLKTLWNSLNPAKAGQGKATSMFDRDKLRMLVEHFSIGTKLRYFPEYQREIIFDTIIIAYRANGQFLYSRDAVVLDAEGFPTGFELAGKKLLPLERLESFQLLLPDTSDMEMTLDYNTRAELGRAGQFRPGNAITLIIESEERSIPTLDTIVDRRLTMTTGPYEDSPTVLVTPDFASLVLADKRRKQRVGAAIRAQLYVAADAPAFHCLLGDFSERSLRLRVADGRYAMPLMAPEEKVVVAFELGAAKKNCCFRGKVFRREDEFCVIQIDEMHKSGHFQKIKPMDIIEITTGLLNLNA